MISEKDLEKVRLEIDKAMAENREEIRQTIAQALAQSVIGKVEQIITDALSQKVGHIQHVQADAEAKAEDARKVALAYEERQKAAEGQLRDLRVEITGAKSQLDELKREAAKLEVRRDKLAGDVSSLEAELMGLSSRSAEKKIASARMEK